MGDSPNLLFIFSDRQRFDTMRCYGNEWIKTPHLNALAEQSFVFQHAYVTQAVCAPARSSIMTGLYPHAAGMPRNKLVMPRDVKTIAEMVSDDYLRAYFGKWHLGDEVVRQHGFDQWVSIMERLWEEYTKEEYRDRHTDYHQFLLARIHRWTGMDGVRTAEGGEGVTGAMIRARIWVAGRLAGGLQALLGAPMAAYSGCGEPDGGIGHGKRRSRTGLTRDCRTLGWLVGQWRTGSVRLGVEWLAVGPGRG